jgi:hypothetical protein
VNHRQLRTLLTRLVVIGGLLSSVSASAQTPEESRVYYGWQALISDVAGVSLILISQQTGHSTAPALVGASLLLFGPPVIHGLHHNWMGLGVSLGMRLGTGLAFVGALQLLADEDGDRSPGILLLGGSLLGAIASVLLDAVFLGFEPRQEQARRHASAYTLTPRVDPRGAVGLQLSAAF